MNKLLCSSNKTLQFQECGCRTLLETEAIKENDTVLFTQKQYEAPAEPCLEFSGNVQEFWLVHTEGVHYYLLPPKQYRTLTLRFICCSGCASDTSDKLWPSFFNLEEGIRRGAYECLTPGTFAFLRWRFDEYSMSGKQMKTDVIFNPNLQQLIDRKQPIFTQLLHFNLGTFSFLHRSLGIYMLKGNTL